MFSVTLLPRKNKIGVAAASVTGKSVVFSDIVWHVLPDNLAGDGMFNNSEEFAHYVEQTLGENAKQAQITICLDASYIPAFVFSHADVGASAVKKMRALELKTLFGDGVDTVYTCDRSLAKGKPFTDGKCRQLIYSIEKSKADKLVSGFEKRGMKLDRLVPFTALFEESANALWAIPSPGSGIKVAVYAGDYDAAVAVYSDGVPVSVRAIDVDALELIESVKHYFKVSEEDARAKIMNGGLEEFSEGMAEDVWLYEKVVGYYREFASAVARSVNSITGGGEQALAGVFIGGTFSGMKDFAVKLGEALNSRILTIEEFANSSAAVYATSPNAAIGSFPLYASFSEKDRINLLDEPVGQAKNKNQGKIICALAVAVIVLVMAIMPLRYFVIKSKLDKLNEKLETPEYVSALELESKVEGAIAAEQDAKRVLEGMPVGQSYAYKCISGLLTLTTDYGRISSIEYNDDMTVSLTVVCDTYPLATGWKNAVNASERYSFVSTPPISRSGMSYELEALLKFDSEAATQADETETTAEAESEEEGTTKDVQSTTEEATVAEETDTENTTSQTDTTEVNEETQAEADTEQTTQPEQTAQEEE